MRYFEFIWFCFVYLLVWFVRYGLLLNVLFGSALFVVTFFFFFFGLCVFFLGVLFFLLLFFFFFFWCVCVFFFFAKTTNPHKLNDVYVWYIESDSGMSVFYLFINMFILGGLVTNIAFFPSDHLYLSSCIGLYLSFRRCREPDSNRLCLIPSPWNKGAKITNNWDI